MSQPSACVVEGCETPSMSKGWCRRHYDSNRHNGHPLGGVAMASGHCLECGNPVPARTGPGPRASYCTKACKLAPASRTASERGKAQRVAAREAGAFTCKWSECGIPLMRGSKWCPEHLNAKRRLASPDSPTKACSHPSCARPVRANELCSMHYKQVLRAEGRIVQQPWNDRRRNNHYIRKAKMDATSVIPFVLQDVIDRDGTECALCLTPIDMALSWPHPFSRSLDHIHPIARGGKHLLENAQLAHLRCNISKSDRMPGDTEARRVRAASIG